MKSRRLDESQAAARVVQETINRHETPLPGDLKAAWAQWSAGVQEADARMMNLLRAAFDAGVKAATRQQKPI